MSSTSTPKKKVLDDEKLSSNMVIDNTSNNMCNTTDQINKNKQLILVPPSVEPKQMHLQLPQADQLILHYLFEFDRVPTFFFFSIYMPSFVLLKKVQRRKKLFIIYK